MIHFGQGQMSAELSLAALGEQGVACLQLADGAHIALEGEEYR